MKEGKEWGKPLDINIETLAATYDSEEGTIVIDRDDKTNTVLVELYVCIHPVIRKMERFLKGERRADFLRRINRLQSTNN